MKLKLKVKRSEEIQPLIGGDERISTKKASLESLLIIANEIREKCEDYTIPDYLVSKSQFFGDCCGHGVLDYPISEEDKRSSALSEFSLGQLCVKLGIPTRYIQRCMNAGEFDLASENVNTWLKSYPKSLFIREYDSGIRAVLSNRYSVLDTHDILEVLGESLPLDEYTIKGYFLSPERFHARIVQREMINIEGEDLYAGIQIDSSDVGRSTLVARFMLFKQICTNGLCIAKSKGTLFVQKHIGIDKDEFRDSFSRSLSNIPLLIDNAVSFVEAARKDKNAFAVKNLNEEQMKQFINRVKENSKLSEDGVNKVIDLMGEKYDFSRWGFVNSLTEVAQMYSLERRIEIEKYAGNILVA